MPASERTSVHMRHTKIPVGIIAVLLFILLELFFMSQLLLRGIALPVGPVILSGIVARIYIVLSMTLLITLCLGFIQQRKWARLVGIMWYVYDMLLALVNLITFKQHPQNFLLMYQQYKPDNVPVLTEQVISHVLSINLLFLLVCGSIITVYVYRSKKWFSR